jgi:NADH-quinone oxidoreductase subunit L
VVAGQRLKSRSAAICVICGQFSEDRIGFYSFQTNAGPALVATQQLHSGRFLVEGPRLCRDQMPVIETTLLRWILLLPLAGTVVCTIAAKSGHARLARVTGPLVVLGAFALSVTVVAQLWAQPAGAALVDHLYTWFHASPLTVEVVLRVDALSSVMILVVTGVGFLIHLYSVGYMHDDPDVARYFAYLNLFTASMLILVLADSLPVLFVGWEGVGLCSYLLIGFWYTDVANADAGRKAFVVNRVGDAAFLIGMFLLFWSLGTIGAPSLSFGEVNRLAPELAASAPWVVSAVCLLLLAGATGKSAQIPLYVWLPDAMAGPTPVSALIHAATMVTAGVYMIARLSPLYVQAPMVLDVVAIIGALTALFAATIALAQKDLKKVLAYSTVSQIGYMFLGLGVGAFSAAIFHLMTHAFFKALLFLGAGSVMHALSGELNMEKMGGLQRKLPITGITFLVAGLAIAGVPGFAGFFSKDMILEAAFESGHRLTWLLGFVAAGLTAFYIFRAYFLVFGGASRVEPEKAHHVHESPPVMAVPLIILAVLAALGGWVGLPHGFLWGDRFGAYLAPAVAAAPASAHHDGGGHVVLLLMVATSLMALGGIGVAYAMYIRAPGLLDAVYARATGIYQVLWHKYWVDEIYDALVVRPYVRLSRFFWQVVDTEIIDGAANGLGALLSASGGVLRRLQTGNVQSYALVMLVGALCLLLAFGGE